MNLFDIFVHIVKLISRSISGSRPVDSNVSLKETQKALKQNLEQLKEKHQENKSLLCVSKQNKQTGSSKRISVSDNKIKGPGNNHHTPKEYAQKAVQQEKLVIENQVVESLVDDYGLSLSAIGNEYGDADELELVYMLTEVQQILSKYETGTQGRKNNANTQQIIDEAEKAADEPFAQKAAAIKQMFEELRNKPKSDMVYFVMYDIENNKIRTRLSKYLEEKGLRRIQRSIFLGQTKQKDYETIRRVLTEIQESYENNDSIIIVPVPEDLLKTMYLIGKEVDFELTLHRCNTVFI